MDAGRRNFDDIDGCGGPPVGEFVATDGTRPARRDRRRRASVSGGASPLRAGGDRGRGLLIGLVAVAVAATAALGVVVASEHDVLDALLSPDPVDTLRRLAGPLVLAGAVFEAVLGAGVMLVRRANPFASLRGLTRDDLLRGAITFLLALFAWTFFVSAIDGGGGRHWWPAALGWLLAVEVLVTAVVAPVLEEHLFRGIVLVGLRGRFGPVIGVLGQAAIYGCAHVWALRDAGRPATVVGMAAVGAVFGWMAHTADDLKAVIVGHMMFGAWVLAERVFGW